MSLASDIARAIGAISGPATHVAPHGRGPHGGIVYLPKPGYAYHSRSSYNAAVRHAAWKERRDRTVAQHKAERHSRRLAAHRRRVAAKQEREARSLAAARMAVVPALAATIRAISPPKHTTRTINRNAIANPFWMRGFTDPVKAMKGQAQANVDQAAFELADAIRQKSDKRSATAQARSLWRLVGGAYGGKMPRLELGTSNPRAAGLVYGDPHAKVHLARDYATRASGVSPVARGQLAHILLHEWAHTRQPVSRRRFGSDADIEGGAEAYAQDVARRFGLHRYHWAYPDLVRRFEKRHSRRYLRRGQFR